jgi:tetratricopeptide (TPR) repeat protein
VTYVGGAACIDCHREESERWRGSHHDLAMAEASTDNVLGDFEAAALEHRGESFGFQRRDGRFLVRTAGAGGAPADFEVAFTFGVDPLQQYLVRLPGGRLQALAAAWDTRPAADGGQRWFHLQPDESVPPGDVLHWTGLAGSWNAMCAECHSTNVSKVYRPQEDTYETTWSELDVSCEACHGPGSAHVAWAEEKEQGGPDIPGFALVVQTPKYDAAAWVFPPEASIAQRMPLREPHAEIDTCAPCHSRRAAIHGSYEHGRPLLDTHRLALLEEGLYHSDGQILDEVYVYGSFLQSRMYAWGVTCSDCHDSHSLALRASGNALCAQCHLPTHYDDPSHHHHPVESTGASCVACHMLARTYMVVDVRHDHSFRIPRPALGMKIAAPDTCSDCHADRSRQWSADAVEEWYGSGQGLGRVFEPHYGEALHAGRRRAPGAARALASLSRDAAQPAIARATALELLGRQLDRGSVSSVLAGVRDPSALVRMAAVGAAEALPPRDRWRALVPLLRDPVRVVRIETGRALAPLRGQIGATQTGIALNEALEEYRAAQSINADRPEAHVNLGLLHTQLAELAAAEDAYETAIRIWPFFVPAYANLADLHRMRNRDDEGERVLREAIARVPDAAPLHHALGLLLVRRQRSDEALTELGLAAEIAPENSRYAYVYGIALHSAGKGRLALAALEASHRSHPGDTDLLVALATLHRDDGELDTALRYARKLLDLRPEDPQTQTLVRELEARRP